jgi:hypothetical protein
VSAGDRAAGRHQHAGTEDGGNSQGEGSIPATEVEVSSEPSAISSPNVGPFLKAFWHGYLPGRCTSQLNFVQFRSTKTWCRFQILPGILQNVGKYVANFAYANNFDFLCVFSEFNLDTPTGHAFIQKAQYRAVAGSRMTSSVFFPGPLSGPWMSVM